MVGMAVTIVLVVDDLIMSLDTRGFGQTFRQFLILGISKMDESAVPRTQELLTVGVVIYGQVVHCVLLHV